jgi:hypothetical protein
MDYTEDASSLIFWEAVMYNRQNELMTKKQFQEATASHKGQSYFRVRPSSLKRIDSVLESLEPTPPARFFEFFSRKPQPMTLDERNVKLNLLLALTVQAEEANIKRNKKDPVQREIVRGALQRLNSTATSMLIEGKLVRQPPRAQAQHT